jgi:small conductance mechanosensitive channel
MIKPMDEIQTLAAKIGKTLIAISGKILVFLAVFIVFYALSQIARRALRTKLTGRLKAEVVTFLSDLVFYILVIIGATVGLSTTGVNMNAVVASLGLGGFALGFALRDMISNFIGGLMVLLTKTYEVGDQIKVNNFEGRVRSINLRHTVLVPIDKDDESSKILVPNGIVYSNITIVSKKPKGGGAQA